MKTRGEVYGNTDPSPFEQTVMKETGASLQEVRAMPNDEFHELLKDCLAARKQREQIKGNKI